MSEGKGKGVILIFKKRKKNVKYVLGSVHNTDDLDLFLWSVKFKILFERIPRNIIAHTADFLFLLPEKYNYQLFLRSFHVSSFHFCSL